jgi:hypothetical protein
MKPVRLICAAVVAAAVTVPTAQAQDFPKPGPEHEQLKKLEGNWDTTFKMAGQESKGKATYKMEVGGLWLVSTYDGEMAGAKFYGHGLDSYDPGKKKFVSVWVDNMVTSPMTMEGTYDKAKKTMTMSGEGPGMDGKPTMYKSESEMPNDNTINFRMYVGGGKEPAFTIVYKRKK